MLEHRGRRTKAMPGGGAGTKAIWAFWRVPFQREERFNRLVKETRCSIVGQSTNFWSLKKPGIGRKTNRCEGGEKRVRAISTRRGASAVAAIPCSLKENSYLAAVGERGGNKKTCTLIGGGRREKLARGAVTFSKEGGKGKISWRL